MPRLGRRKKGAPLLAEKELPPRHSRCRRDAPRSTEEELCSRFGRRKNYFPVTDGERMGPPFKTEYVRKDTAPGRYTKAP